MPTERAKDEARQAQKDSEKTPVAVGPRGGTQELQGGKSPKEAAGPTGTKDGTVPGPGGTATPTLKSEEDTQAQRDLSQHANATDNNETDDAHDEPVERSDNPMDGEAGRPYDATQEPGQQQPPHRAGQNAPSGS
jgi:hypothetical protein